MNKGWICPKCGKVWAPYIEECRECNGGGHADRTVPAPFISKPIIIPAPIPPINPYVDPYSQKDYEVIWMPV